MHKDEELTCELFSIAVYSVNINGIRTKNMKYKRLEQTCKFFDSDDLRNLYRINSAVKTIHNANLQQTSASVRLSIKNRFGCFGGGSSSFNSCCSLLGNKFFRSDNSSFK